MKRTVYWFVFGCVIVGVVVAIVYWIYAIRASSLEGFYEVTDGFTDVTEVETAIVSFVRINDYDSVKIGRISELLTRESVDAGKVSPEQRRMFLYHFYVASDTSSLTTDMVDELAYTYPSLTNSSDILQVIPGGWVVKATYQANKTVPEQVVIKRSQFYKPRPGIKAKDLR